MFMARDGININIYIYILKDLNPDSILPISALVIKV